MTKRNFRAELHKLRPDIAQETKHNQVKRKLALALRALRKEKRMTQKDIERNSTLTQPVISRLEAPIGALPNWDTIVRYIEACNGHMLVGFSAHKLDEMDYVDPEANNNELVAALAV